MHMQYQHRAGSDADAPLHLVTGVACLCAAKKTSNACLESFMSFHKPQNALHPVYEPLGSELSQNHTQDSLMIAGQ